MSIIIFLLLLLPSIASASVLGDTAASMAAGTWAEVTTNNISILAQNGTDGNIVSFAWNAAYDPVTKKLFYAGQDHMDKTEPYNPADDVKFVIYDIATNTWSLGPQPFSTYSSGVQHTFHSNYQHAIDTATGTVYIRNGFVENLYHKYSIAGGTWSATSNYDSLVTSTGLAGTAFAPDAGGMLIAQGGDVGGARVQFYKPATDTWSGVATNLNCSGEISSATYQLGAYNPLYKLFVFGTNGCLYKVDEHKTVTALTTPPVQFYSGSGVGGVLVPDPVSGNFIYLDSDIDDQATPKAPRQMRTYNPSTDTWSAPFSPATTPADLIGGYGLGIGRTALAFPMPDFGVIGFLYCVESTCHLYLYKHASQAQQTDFATRCAQRGVIRCFNFDSNSELGAQGANATPPALGANFGTFASLQDHCNTLGDTDLCPTIDTSQAASGTGSLHFIVPSLKGADTSGFWFTNLSEDLQTQFGENSTWFVQWRQRFSPEFLSTFFWADPGGSPHTNPAATITPGANTGNGVTFTASASVFGSGDVGSYIASMDVPTTHLGQIVGFTDGTHVTVNIILAFSGAITSGNWALATRQQGWKQMSMSTGDISPTQYENACTTIDIVNQNTQQRGFGQMYHNCGLYAGFEPFTTPPGDILLQNARPSPYCTYTQWANNNPPTSFPPTGNCIGYFPNEWMTFKIEYQTGPLTPGTSCVDTDLGGGNVQCYKNSRIRMWIARDGQPSQLAIDYTRDLVAALDGPAPGSNLYGKVWLLPYQTNKDATQPTVRSNIWYDELVVSTQDIADPGFAGLSGATYYVATTGSDSNSCDLAKNPATAKLTINAGIGCLSAGDTLIVHAGTYTEGISSIPSGSSSSAHTILKAATGESVTINGSTNSCTGVAPGVICIDNSQNITIDGLNIVGSTSINVGIESWNSNNLTLTNNTVTQTNGTGIGLYSTTHDVLVQGNSVHDNSQINIEQSGQFRRGLCIFPCTWGGGVINQAATSNITYQNNSIYFNHGEGLTVGGPNTLVEGNVIADNWGANLYYNYTPSNATVRGNLIYTSSDAAVYPTYPGSNPTNDRPDGIPVSNENGGGALTNFYVYNNILINSPIDSFVDSNPGSTQSNINIFNNTILNNDSNMTYDIKWNWDIAVNGLNIRNNILYTAAGQFITTNLAASAKTISNNVYYSTGTPAWIWAGTSYSSYGSWAAVTGDSGSLTSNPSLVNTTTPCRLWVDPRGILGAPCTIAQAKADGGDFKLQTGSPAINASACLGSPYNSDFTGAVRPQGISATPCDLGAFEFPLSNNSPAGAY